VLLTQDPSDIDPALFSGDYQRACATCAALSVARVPLCAKSSTR
jgi:hypothetical protein